MRAGELEIGLKFVMRTKVTKLVLVLDWQAGSGEVEQEWSACHQLATLLQYGERPGIPY